MATKQLLFALKARTEMLEGINLLANAVRVTLGPRGRNVMIEKSFGAPVVTKDGVTVAREITLEDPFRNMGAQMVKEVASKTSDMAGDGTTTATVLAQAIFEEGLKAVAAGMDPMDLKRGIDRAVVAAVDELKRISVPCRDTKEIAQVGAILDHERPVGEQLLLNFQRAVESLLLKSSSLEDAHRAILIANHAKQSCQTGQRIQC